MPIPRISLRRRAKAPLFAQLAAHLRDAIEHGTLRSGERLPGTRSLAQSLGVHRNTVLRAYDSLDTEGWIVAETGRGHVVRTLTPRPAQSSSCLPSAAAYRLGRAPAKHEHSEVKTKLNLRGGLPDPRLFPVRELSQAFRRALLGRGGTSLTYSNPQGHPQLRKALARFLATERGLHAQPEQLLVTQGSQQALALIGDLLIKPGDRVGVERLGYAPAWEAFRRAGAELVPFDVDEDGLDVPAVEDFLKRKSLRAIYLTPHHQYPTLATLSAPRRLALLAAAKRYGVALIEDDYDFEMHYDGMAVAPLASLDEAGSVIYLGTLSKSLAPGLRCGYVAAPPPVIARLTAARSVLDDSGVTPLHLALAEMLEEGEVQRHTRRVRRHYAERRGVLAEALVKQLGDQVEFALPAGGMALWLKLGLSARNSTRWVKASIDAGVGLVPASRFDFAGRDLPNLRLGFAAATPTEIRQAVRLMAKHWPR